MLDMSSDSSFLLTPLYPLIEIKSQSFSDVGDHVRVALVG